MARNAGLLCTIGRIRPIEEQVARSAVDQAAVRAVIARVFGDARPITVTVGPD